MLLTLELHDVIKQASVPDLPVICLCGQPHLIATSSLARSFPQAVLFHFQDYANAPSLHFYHFEISIFFLCLLFYFLFLLSLLFSLSFLWVVIHHISFSCLSRGFCAVSNLVSNLEYEGNLSSLFPHTPGPSHQFASRINLIPYLLPVTPPPQRTPLFYDISSSLFFYLYVSYSGTSLFLVAITASSVRLCAQWLFN